MADVRLIVKHCACGLWFTLDGWERLPRAGFYRSEDPHVVLELRDCHCGSTLALEYVVDELELLERLLAVRRTNDGPKPAGGKPASGRLGGRVRR